MPCFSPHTGAGRNDVGARRRVGEERVDRDDEPGRVERVRGQRAVGEVDERVGAEQHERVDLARGRGGEDAGGVEARRVGHRAPVA